MAKKSTIPPKFCSVKFRRASSPKLRPRRVLYIITKSVWGGAAKYVYDLAVHLPKDKFTVFAAAGGDGKFAQAIKKAGLPYFEIKNFQKNVNPLKDIFAFFEILNLFFQLKPDIIHVNSSKAGGLAGLAALIYKISSKLPTANRQPPTAIFTAHGWVLAEDRPKWQIFLIKFFSKITALFYNKIICVSGFDREMAVKNKIAPAHKLITIHNGINLKTLNFLSKKEAREKLLTTYNLQLTTSKTIGTIAEWAKNKGLFFLLEAAIKIKADLSKPLEIILIGSGENPDKEKMYDFIKKHNLENVRLIEFIPDAASYLKAFDIFILPSLKEGLPYVILEAMAAKTPIIATRVGGVPEMIEPNIESILIEPKKPDLIKEKIIYLLKNPVVGRQMAKRAEIKVKKEFSLEKMIEETKKVYEAGR
ncbi:MAG: hypothetical protein A3I88_02370 [Candidatus Portnoybacteria bacterium RIFCSPLOWO2_12_FULL_39_9]|uniref:Glycosyl transferase family 1 n=1 Tax=Candidatus Portnoybacteria bacterium RIFCSPHIGHO2_12_FULL_38_9 TaxID=1801997 RepID=A0A1G2FGA9_9BACT|nr:MAG: hypothetical protein A3H00_01095 [Candidatus Portnoybacteria bacterium RBG_13_40_8]OGZ35710.1 MAG: hypothetical protein A2646_02720 [Candidatus Portnoybacteria bacterium RIFCSPHIGHO2_02_FULL_39_12]OGZ37083.1 MAG: hypothetical protein A3J64_01050 [Candidatus Portnoybacteria bacterium RIFCSPHIGHO2_12_FULL_38_9]OGZ37726.1 MAG: hypothetical protein A3F21_03310 [Candidatus Portnoybacteria bacterium RIFCSPLOWO2_01_FULL_38_39]OGZ39680.1 MAG: hypothetical protein A3I88_02370 [Candidatus Portnoy